MLIQLDANANSIVRPDQILCIVRTSSTIHVRYRAMDNTVRSADFTGLPDTLDDAWKRLLHILGNKVHVFEQGPVTT